MKLNEYGKGRKSVIDEMLIIIEKKTKVAIKAKEGAKIKNNNYKEAHLAGVIGISAQYKVYLNVKGNNLKIKKCSKHQKTLKRI